MLKVVGWLFVVGGAFLTMTIFLAGFGVPMFGLGVTILVGVALVDRHARHALERQELYRPRIVEEDAVQKSLRERGVSNSMFGR
jgi:hypothetical protein